MINHNKYNAYIFDLDNTLYNETKYLNYAYKAIAESIDHQYSKGFLNVFQFLQQTFETEGRKNLFDKLIVEYDLPAQVVQLCIKYLRTVKIIGKMNLEKNMKSCLELLASAEKKIFVLTNGNVQQQRNKVAQINWSGFDDRIAFYYADKIEPKPSPAGILKIIADNDLVKSEILFIGDDEVDRLAAEAVAIDFVYTKDFNCITEPT